MSTAVKDRQEFLSIKQVADRLNVCYRTALREIERGHLPAYRVGVSYRIAENDLAEYLTSRKVR